MKKQLLTPKAMRKAVLYTCALFAFASCADNTYMGEKEEETKSGGAISFNFDVPTPTRAGSETDANALNKNFVVYGYKTMPSGTPTTQPVFNNYQVNYVKNSTTNTTTTSNTHGWEYVGYKNLPDGVKTNVGVTNFATTTGDDGNKNGIDQTIKYWDYLASNYKFYAYSLGTGTGTTPTFATSSKMPKEDSGDTYTLTGSEDELAACYISELLTVNDLNSKPTSVELKFLTIQAKLELGFYETIPGYSVKNLRFYTSKTGTSTKDDNTNENLPTLFQNVDADSYTLPKNGSYTVSFDASGKPLLTWTAATTDGKQGNVKFSALTGLVGKEKNETDENVYLGRDANKAVKTGLKSVLPPTTTGTGNALTLKVDYTLVSTDGTEETIEVKGKTATVPAAYTLWKPNYKYTYLFKISDDQLTPITFDAVVLTDADGNQETITTVPNGDTEPSITTYSKESAVTSTNYEYITNNVIYVVAGDGTTALTVGTNAKLYIASVQSEAAQTITEASVANAIASGAKDDDTNPTTWTVTDANNKKLTVTALGGLSAGTSIPAEASPTGTAINIYCATFNPQNTYFKIKSGTTLDTSKTYYSYDSTNQTYSEIASPGASAGDNTYEKTSGAGYYVFEYTYDTNKKAYKVIKVVAAP